MLGPRGKPFVEDLTAFYIPESIISKISPNKYLRYKMVTGINDISLVEYKELCMDIESKIGIPVMLVYPHKNLTDVIGGTQMIKEHLTLLECHDSKERFWGAPSYDIFKLIELLVELGKGGDLQELDIFPVRWTPDSKRDGSPIYP